jgi:putative flippase GtrA
VRINGRELLTFAKAQLSTGAATLAEWGCVWVLAASGVYYVLAAIGGALLGGLLDFSIKKWWVFGTARRFAAAEALRYAIVSGLSALLFGGAVYLLVDELHARMPLAVVIASMFVGIFWNYPLHRFFVFSAARSAGSPS